MKKNIIFLISTAFILIFCGTYIYAFHSPRYNVAEIQIKGNNKISQDEIRKKVERYMGKNIFSLRLERIEESVREDVRLRDIQAQKILPATISIEVAEKTPVLWISLPMIFPNQVDCGLCGLSMDQEIIPLDENDLSHDLPIVTGIEMEEGRSVFSLKPYQRWSNLKIHQALEFYTEIKENDPSSMQLLAEINLSNAPNLILYLLPYRNKVLLGPGDLERKWRMVKTILAADKKPAELLCLDLRFDDQVVLTRSSSSEDDSTNLAPEKKGKKSN